MQKNRAANDEMRKLTVPKERASERAEAQVEFEIAIDPGPDFDSEGWVEQRDYWSEQARSKKPTAIQRWVAALRAILARLSPTSSARRRARLAQETEFSHEDWARLSESALGPLHTVRSEIQRSLVPSSTFNHAALPAAWIAATHRSEATPQKANDARQRPGIPPQTMEYAEQSPAPGAASGDEQPEQSLQPTLPLELVATLDAPPVRNKRRPRP